MTVTIRTFIKLIFLILLLSINTIVLADPPKNYLKGKFYNSIKNNFLVATEKMRDNRFSKTVIVILENDEYGAWGLTINKSIGILPLGSLIDPSLNTTEKSKKIFSTNVTIYWGGPVEQNEIFILHTPEYKSNSTKNYGNISISKDHKILFDIAKNNGPKDSLIILGYSGWASGQLEGEMEKDHWELSEINLDTIFRTDNEKKWLKATKNNYIKL